MPGIFELKTRTHTLFATLRRLANCLVVCPTPGTFFKVVKSPKNCTHILFPSHNLPPLVSPVFNSFVTTAFELDVLSSAGFPSACISSVLRLSSLVCRPHSRVVSSFRNPIAWFYTIPRLSFIIQAQVFRTLHHDFCHCRHGHSLSSLGIP